jgi:hypothetical protein
MSLLLTLLHYEYCYTVTSLLRLTLFTFRSSLFIKFMGVRTIFKRGPLETHCFLCLACNQHIQNLKKILQKQENRKIFYVPGTRTRYYYYPIITIFTDALLTSKNTTNTKYIVSLENTGKDI